MANPTLIAQDEAWRGFTLDELAERLLASRGMTLDADTGRTLATTTEEAEAKNYLKMAADFCALEFPSLWNTRHYTVAWTDGDHSIALPANVMVPLAVTFDGRSLKPLSRDDYYRLLRNDDEGGDVSDAGRPAYYRVTGYSDEGAASRDWRVVLRVHPQPSSTYAGKTLAVEYLALAGDYAAGEADDLMALYPYMQAWILQHSKELYAAENGDSAIQGVAEKARVAAGDRIHNFLQGTRQNVKRFTFRYPTVTRRRRYR